MNRDVESEIEERAKFYKSRKRVIYFELIECQIEKIWWTYLLKILLSKLFKNNLYLNKLCVKINVYFIYISSLRIKNND